MVIYLHYPSTCWSDAIAEVFPIGTAVQEMAFHSPLLSSCERRHKRQIGEHGDVLISLVENVMKELTMILR